MALHTAHSHADPTPEPRPTQAALAAAESQAPQPAGRIRAFAYLDTENTNRYRQLMGVLLANKRRFGLRLGPAQVSTRLWERFSVRYETTDALERDLAALCGWGAVDRYQDCTAGWPNTGVAAILDAAEAASMEILVHADGDPAGAAIAAGVLKRTGARPWRSVDAKAGIHEESLLDELLDDLGSGCVGQRRLV